MPKTTTLNADVYDNALRMLRSPLVPYVVLIGDNGTHYLVVKGVGPDYQDRLFTVRVDELQRASDAETPPAA